MHEVKPVTRGLRLVLKYKFVNTQPAIALPKASDITESDIELGEILKDWDSTDVSEDQLDSPDFVCHI